jgi:uncharacterized protein YcnI
VSAARLARGAAAPLAVAVLLAWAVTAQAHVTLRPGASRPADLQRYTFLVPNEREAATTDVRIRVPQGIDFLLVERPPGWRAQAVRRGGRVAELRFAGGRIEPDEYLDLHVVARNPVRTGELVWPALQTYADGKVVRWIEPADGEQPAPRVKLSEDAVPVDLVSTHGETPTAGRAAAARPQPVGAAASAADDDDDVGWALALGGAALAVAALALAVALMGRRRRGGASA